MDDGSLLLANYPTSQQWQDGFQPVPGKALHERKPLTSFLLRHSHFHSLVYHKMSLLASRMRSSRPDTFYDMAADSVHYSIVAEPGQQMKDAMDIVLILFDGMKQLSVEHNFKLIVVNVPSRVNIDPRLQQRLISDYDDVDEGSFDFTAVSRRFSHELSLMNITFIDLQEIGEEHYKEMYFLEGHWSPQGVKMISDYLIEEMLAQGLITIE